MALYYCLGTVAAPSGKRATVSIQVEATDRNHALRLARQELSFRYWANAKVTSAVRVDKGAVSGYPRMGG